MTRFRLTARAQMHGELREPGYVFTLAEGQVGPHRTVSASPGVNIADHIGAESTMVDEPLYRPLSDEENAALDALEAETIAAADAHAEACAARDAEQARLAEGGSAEDVLKLDGPTVGEWVAAGYPVDAYPPSGYASRSTPEEIAALKPPAANANASDGKDSDPEAGGEKPPAE